MNDYSLCIVVSRYFIVMATNVLYMNTPNCPSIRPSATEILPKSVNIELDLLRLSRQGHFILLRILDTSGQKFSYLFTFE